MITLYHNPRCSKSRAALTLLRDHGQEPDIILYLDSPPSAEELQALLVKLGIDARGLLRKTETAYTELQLDNEKLSEAALINVMARYPKLIERPIAVSGDKAVIGRPPEHVLQLV